MYVPGPARTFALVIIDDLALLLAEIADLHDLLIDQSHSTLHLIVHLGLHTHTIIARSLLGDFELNVGRWYIRLAQVQSHPL
jgi:hypothetical protein